MAATTRGLIHKKENLLGRFRGAMVGAVVGDCLGAHFEMTWNVAVKQVVDFFARLSSLTPTSCGSDSDSEKQQPDPACNSSPNKKRKYSHQFTDDTAMARSVAASLITNNKVDARDMAKRFAREYSHEPWRGYGGSVAHVFRQLEEEEYKAPHGPASRQFEGSGSYGNGGAMRIVPAALFAYNLDEKELNSVVDAITKVTHTHQDALNGARLQCAAVRASLQQPAGTHPDPDRLLDQLDAIALALETASSVGTDGEATRQGSPPSKRKRKSEGGKPYCDKLELIREYLKSEAEISRSAIAEFLGNDVSALGSVPAAIYSFLRASRPIPDVPVKCAFERTIIYAVTLGGDTDTIATMAGAMAGAYYGIDEIPSHWRETCEGVEEADAAAVKLHRAVVLDRCAGDICADKQKTDDHKGEQYNDQKCKQTPATESTEQGDDKMCGDSIEEVKKD